MKIVVTRQNPDGTYDEVGMNNRRVCGPYKNFNSAFRYALPDWKKHNCRFEFFPDTNFSRVLSTKIRYGEIKCSGQ